MDLLAAAMFTCHAAADSTWSAFAKAMLALCAALVVAMTAASFVLVLPAHLPGPVG